MKKWISILVFCLALTEIVAQQQVMFSQYMFNGLAINPAYAGSHDAISMTALARVQWVGIDGAPTTQTFSVHSPVPEKNIGLGGLFVRDNIGVTTQTSFFASYSYRLETSIGILSMGLHAGFSDTQLRYTDLGVDDENLLSDGRSFDPNFGAGIYFQNQKFYGGISIPFLLKNNPQDQGGVSDDIGIQQIQHYYLTAGAIFDLSPLVRVKPNLLVKSVPGAPIEFDLNANVILDDRLWLGMSYRSLDAISLLIEIQLNNQLRLGYAYDITLTELKQISSGSHEVMLNYRFVFPKHKIVTPRYF